MRGAWAKACGRGEVPVADDYRFEMLDHSPSGYAHVAKLMRAVFPKAAHLTALERRALAWARGRP